MATYAIGDVQGCYSELCALLEKIRFDERCDRLWFVGDLVNRGPGSLETLRFVKRLGERAVTVLGNHDLHLVALASGYGRVRGDDTLDAVLGAPDRDDLIDWLRTLPLLHVAERHVMVHAGVLPQWSVEKAQRLAREVEDALRGPRHREFLGRMYGSKPDKWRDDLRGIDRLRVIVNAMTRLRFCTREGSGAGSSPRVAARTALSCRGPAPVARPGRGETSANAAPGNSPHQISAWKFCRYSRAICSRVAW